MNAFVQRIECSVNVFFVNIGKKSCGFWNLLFLNIFLLKIVRIGVSCPFSTYTTVAIPTTGTLKHENTEFE